MQWKGRRNSTNVEDRRGRGGKTIVGGGIGGMVILLIFTVVPESFTHGTSEQRKRWFYKGFQSGTLQDGDTFHVKDL